MEKLIINVNREQKDNLVKLFEMLHLSVEVESGEWVMAVGDQEQFDKQLEACLGMWQDLAIDNDEYRKQAWGGRGI